MDCVKVRINLSASRDILVYSISQYLEGFRCRKGGTFRMFFWNWNVLSIVVTRVHLQVPEIDSCVRSRFTSDLLRKFRSEDHQRRTPVQRATVYRSSCKPEIRNCRNDDDCARIVQFVCARVHNGSPADSWRILEDPC